MKSTEFREYDYWQKSYYILSRKFPLTISLKPSFNNMSSEELFDQGSFMINLRVDWEPCKTINRYFNKYLAEFVKKGLDLIECRNSINAVTAECNKFVTDIIITSMDPIMTDIIKPKILELRTDSKYYPNDYPLTFHNASYQSAIEELVDDALRSHESIKKIKGVFNCCYAYLSEYIHQFVAHQMRMIGYNSDEDMFNMAINKDENCETYQSIFGTTFFYPNGLNYDEVGGNS